MNWPLKSRAEDYSLPLEGPLPSVLDQASGAIKDYYIRSDSWSWKESVEGALREEMQRALTGRGFDASQSEIADAISNAPMIGGAPLPDAGSMRNLRSLAEMDAAFEQIQLGRQFDPQTFGSLPASRQEFEAEVARRRQKELADNEAMLGRGDSAAAQFGGQMIGAITDEWSAPFMGIGGGAKSFGMAILSEAAINAAAEVPQVIKQRQVAEELGFEAQNPIVQIGTAGLAGAGFAAVLGGGARALDYVIGRRLGEAEAMGATNAGLNGEIAIDAAERALRAGEEPLTARLQGLDFAAVEQQYGLPSGYLGRTAWIESRGNPAAQNPNSSAGGLFQFIDGTASDYGLTNRFEPVSATDAAARLARDNAIVLRKVLGRDPTGAELYLAHQQGGAGAARLLSSPDARAADIVGAEAVRLNGGSVDMTAREFAGLWLRKYDGAKSATVNYDPMAPVDSYRPAGAPAGRRPFSTRIDEVTTPAGTRVQVRYRVVDLSELRAASGDLQPRDRTRAASDEQIAEMAARLDPARLMPSAEADRGAPIVGPDMMVESGNGRIAALNRAATENPQAYAAYVEAIRAEMDIPEGVTRPVLIAERTSELTPEGRRAFVRESNTSGIARMAPSEQARLDADFLDYRSFEGYRTGRGLNAPENAPFVRRMLSAMPQAERAALLTADGRLNIDGVRRLRQTLFARAFGADDLLRLAAETESPAVETLLRMLEDLAPDWAAFRSMVDAGFIRQEFDITDALVETVRLIARARLDARDGQSVIAAIRDRLSQGDLFGERDPMTEALLDVFYRGDRARNPEAAGDILRRYAAEAATVGRADMNDLLENPVTPPEALKRAVDGYEGRTAYTPAEPPEIAPDAGPVAPLGDIAAMDTARFADGAASPAVERANDALADQLREATPAPDAEAGAQLDAAQADWEGLRDTKFKLSADDTAEVTVGEVLDDLDQDRALIEAMTSCALKGVA